MANTPQNEKKENGVEDLAPETRDQKDVAAGEADAVRGGRKAGGDQQDYLKVTMSDVLIS